jgi:hypothetical protein
VIENKGNSDAFVCRFNGNEAPAPLPAAGPGYWLSKDSGSANSLHLDIDICPDGSFKGMWQMYFCLIYLGCFITDEIPPEPVFGTIDLENNTGLINMPASDCKDIPFVINKQSPDKLRISIHPGEKTSNCFGSTGSILLYQGESENGKCSDDSTTPGGGKDTDGSGGGGVGGGGGCFILVADDAGGRRR